MGATSELLYSDALDRRERMKTLTEQVQAQEAVPTQVLSRSRRYYWQMLERQIKTAFDHAAHGSAVLRFAALEDFLVRFGCMRPRERNQQGGSDDESRRLCAALRRRLDPQ